MCEFFGSITQLSYWDLAYKAWNVIHCTRAYMCVLSSRCAKYLGNAAQSTSRYNFVKSREKVIIFYNFKCL